MSRHAEVDGKVAELLSEGRVDAAAAAVLEAYGPEIVRFLRSVLRDEAAASDAFSVFAEDVWREIASFRGDAGLRTWCYRIAFRAANSLRRDPNARRKHRLESADATERLWEELAPEEQALLSLRIDCGMSWREIAEVLSTRRK